MHERRFSPTQAHRLDDPERKTWLPPEEILSKLDLQPGQTVADIGAGTGYFSLPLAKAVGKDGKIFAVDVEPQMLALLQDKLSESGCSNIECQAAEATETKLPAESCDLVFLANIWHELDDPAAMFGEASRLLKSTGKLAILDWRADLDSPPGPPQEHRVARKELEAALCNHGWKIVSASAVAGYSYLVIAEQPNGSIS